MTQEDKELLLKYLCMALPYGMKVHIKGEYHKYHDVEEIDISDECVRYFENWHLYEEKITDCRLYLRPMSSMTEEEKKEYERTFDSVYDVDDYGEDADSWHKEFSIRSLDWLLEHHFDFMGLIPKGLAIEVTNENNPYKK